MIENRSVALVGRPNVGKSRLFNRLSGTRLAIVHDQPGVTRDVNAVEVNGDYMLMDTGGIGLTSDMESRGLIAAAEEQVFFAVEAATLILFVVDGREGLTALDEAIAAHLRRHFDRVQLVVNKVDDPTSADERAAEFARLGFGAPVCVSAEHGINVSQLESVIAERLGPKPPAEPVEEFPRVRICFAGRPNVGKSSLCNRLLDSDRLVVSEVAGTTRDSVELDLDYKATNGETWHFRLIDTAGVRRKSRVASPVELFANMRTETAIEGADVAFLVIDAVEGLSQQDKLFAGKILEMGKSLAVVVNKWDLAIDRFRSGGGVGTYESVEAFREQYEKTLRREMFFLPDSPIIFASALTGYALEQILKAALEIERHSLITMPTGRVNNLLKKLVQKREPRVIANKRFKMYYAVHLNRKPHVIRIFCNRETALEDGYRRYLENAFQREFGLPGCPIRFSLAGKEKRYAGKDKPRTLAPSGGKSPKKRMAPRGRQVDYYKKKRAKRDASSGLPQGDGSDA